MPMNQPDGPEERELEREEAAERAAEFDALMVDEDEDVTLVSPVPVCCIVYSHDWHPRTHYCRRCGQDRNDEVGQTRVWL
jgi:hypothetical protein